LSKRGTVKVNFHYKFLRSTQIVII